MCLIVCMYEVLGMYVVTMRGAVDRRADEQQKKINSGMPYAQRRGNKDTKLLNEICRPEFSSSSMETGQVAEWCVGRERR